MSDVAVLRALGIAKAHPAVRDVRVVDRAEDGLLEAELDIVTELPAAWRMTGESPSGVRAVETVSLVFPPDFPSDSPRAFLRADFNRSHPHLIPGPATLPPMPCVVRGFPSELIQTRGFGGYVDQLADWLDKAAMLELNNPDHGWEPVRRDHIHDALIVDGEALRSLAAPQGVSATFRTRFARVDGDKGERNYQLAVALGEPVDVDKPECGVGAARDRISYGQGIAIVAAAADANDRPHIVDTQAPETVSTVAELLERAELYGCRAELDAKLNHVALGVAQGRIAATPCAVIFLVRRPFTVIGANSDLELCAYVIDLRANDDLLNGRGCVRLCAEREMLSVALLRRASGDDEQAPRPPWSLLGSGSVGSKIATHLVRRGLGPAVVVDQSGMQQHNYARHALSPNDLDHGALVMSKADALAQTLELFRQPARAERRDVVALTRDEDGRRTISAGGFVLNTTASTVVREHLSFLNWEERPRFAEAHLLGAGSAAYAAFEGPAGNPNASDLAAESYRLIAAEPELRARVFSAQAEAIQIGQGCSAVTFPMPDDRLSALCGGLSSLVAERLTSPLEGAGEVAIGRLASDGLAQSWTRTRVPPAIALDAGGGRQVRISQRVDDQIRAAIADKPGVETGGVIIGRFSPIGNAFQVVDTMPAPIDSVFSEHRFTLGVTGLRAAIRQLLRDGGGSLYVLGTWHNHQVKSGPSALDAATALRLAMRQHFPVLMLIALPDGYTCLSAETFELGDGAAQQPTAAE